MTHGTPSTGSIIGGKYRVERLLGEGGMGAVFEAQNTTTGKRVAIKWMHAEVAKDPDAVQRFIREAQASARVRHPNVVDVYDVLTEGASLFLVMELLEGEPLSKLMQRESVSLPEFIGLLIQAMRGVAAAHKQGVIHRDIKPDNIFIARQNDGSLPVAKVLDFGISKLSGEGELALTATGAVIGTPLYMSVEQLQGVKDIDARTDVYALGAILYQGVTGAPPFDADTFPALVAKILSELPVDPKALRKELPTSLAKLVLNALEKDRNLRVPTVEEFIRQLEPFAAEERFLGQMTRASHESPSIRTPNSRRAAAAESFRESDFVARANTGLASVAERTPRFRLIASGMAAAVLAAVALWLASRSSDGATEVARGRAARPADTHAAPVTPPAATRPSTTAAQKVLTAPPRTADDPVTVAPVQPSANANTDASVPSDIARRHRRVVARPSEARSVNATAPVLAPPVSTSTPLSTSPRKAPDPYEGR